MKRFQISLAGLMLWIGALAIGLAGLASSPNVAKYWQDAIVVLTVLLLFTAVAGAMFRQAEQRAYWAGVSLFGWGSLWLFFYAADRFTGFFFIQLILSKILREQQVAHWIIAKCMITTVLAVFGGCVARYFYTIRDRDQSSDQKTNPPD